MTSKGTTNTPQNQDQNLTLTLTITQDPSSTAKNSDTILSDPTTHQAIYRIHDTSQGHLLRSTNLEVTRINTPSPISIGTISPGAHTTKVTDTTTSPPTTSSAIHKFVPPGALSPSLTAPPFLFWQCNQPADRAAQSATFALLPPSPYPSSPLCVIHLDSPEPSGRITIFPPSPSSDTAANTSTDPIDWHRFDYLILSAYANIATGVIRIKRGMNVKEYYEGNMGELLRRGGMKVGWLQKVVDGVAVMGRH